MQLQAYEEQKPLSIGNNTDNHLLKSVYEWSETVLWCFLFVALLFTFAFRVVGVNGYSMDDTLHDTEKLIAIDWFTPRYGDIVAITQPAELNKPLVKRVIATEGQTVNIDFANGAVTVDGKRLSENYIKEPTSVKGDISFPVTVPKGCVFVMGDNRNHSTDSRFSEVGMVDTRYIFGKVLFRIFPFNRFGAFGSVTG